MLLCIIGDVNLDHLSKVVTGRILLWKFTIIPFLIDKYFSGENQAMHRSYFCFNFHLLFQYDLAYDGDYYGVIRVIIYFSHLLHIYSLEFFSRNFFQFSITYSATYLYSQNGAEPCGALPNTKAPPSPLILLCTKAESPQDSPESKGSRLKQLMIRTTKSESSIPL